MDRIRDARPSDFAPHRNSLSLVLLAPVDVAPALSDVWAFITSSLQQSTSLPRELRARFLTHLEQWRRDYEGAYCD